MKTKKKHGIKLAVFFALLFSALAGSDLWAGVPVTKADHLAVADKYERLATDQEAVVKEHKEMKKDYQANQASLPKGNREQSIRDMDKHCDALIVAAQKEADEYRAIAQWHKIRATEAEK